MMEFPPRIEWAGRDNTVLSCIQSTWQEADDFKGGLDKHCHWLTHVGLTHCSTSTNCLDASVTIQYRLPYDWPLTSKRIRGTNAATWTDQPKKIRTYARHDGTLELAVVAFFKKKWVLRVDNCASMTPRVAQNQNIELAMKRTSND